MTNANISTYYRAVFPPEPCLPNKEHYYIHVHVNYDEGDYIFVGVNRYINPKYDLEYEIYLYPKNKTPEFKRFPEPVRKLILDGITIVSQTPFIKAMWGDNEL